MPAPHSLSSSSLSGQAARFLVVGGFATLVDIGLFNAVHLGLGWHPVIAKSLSTAAGATIAFLGNRHWSFEHGASGPAREQGLPFLLVTAASLLIALVPVWVAHGPMGLRGAVAMNLAANVVGLGLATAFRFFAYRRFVFAPSSSAGFADQPSGRALALAPARQTT